MFDLRALLRTLAEFSSKEKVPLFLAGAFALQAYGLSRATADLDLLSGKAFRPRVTSFFEGLGFEEHSQAPGFSAYLHPLGGRVDLIWVDEETLEKIEKEARPCQLFSEAEFRVLSPRHLAALKIFAVKNDPRRIFREWPDLLWLLKNNLVSWEEMKKIAEKYGVPAILRRLDSEL
ncbi:nucleotidyl transferase AbiEii/AbiGii toxin family protein [Thermosulfurimonas marina]|uniref:nucleotidyl transferase AbiEii/AbiGii toxin family protein n=1 Tax=Thermosulfurimonas marina TaxID=2047767 RepID=UPI00144A8166|nr:nucleotidyl transferase AbiEii/AbiGii toxin family protein [Thermosulfurimonas marina]